MASTFKYIVAYKLRNFSWSLDETVLCRDRLNARGVTLVSTMESLSITSADHLLAQPQALD